MNITNKDMCRAAGTYPKCWTSPSHPIQTKIRDIMKVAAEKSNIPLFFLIPTTPNKAESPNSFLSNSYLQIEIGHFIKTTFEL